MSHWQHKLQLKLLETDNILLTGLFLSFVLHIIVFLPFVFFNKPGTIIIDSNNNIYLPVYYKFGGQNNITGYIGGPSKNFQSKSNKNSKNNINNNIIKKNMPALKQTSNSFAKLKRVSKKTKIKQTQKKSKNKNIKKIKNKQINKIETLKNTPEKLPENKPQENLENKIEPENKTENNISANSLGAISGDNPGLANGLMMDGYLMTDAELVEGIRAAVGKNWTAPKGFPDVYCEFKVSVSLDGKTVKILEQKNSKILAFNIQAKGAILNTQFPEKCWGKELNLILR